MKVPLIARDPSSWSCNEISREIREAGHIPLPVGVNNILVSISEKSRILYGTEEISRCSIALVRSLGRGSVEETLFRIGILQLLEKANVKVVNSASSIATSANKVVACALLRKAGLLTPETFATPDMNTALNKFAQLDTQIVLKPIFGSLGKGITRTEDAELAERAFEFLRQVHAVPFCQKYINASNGDTRAIIVGEQVLGAVSRRGKNWKSNVAVGARANPIPLSSNIEENVRSAAKATGAEIAGVDMIRAKEGIYVLEVNTQPGFREFSRATGVNAAREIARYVISKARR